MSTHGEKYEHLVGKHVDEAIETLKNDGKWHVSKEFLSSIVKYFRSGTTCIPSHGSYSQRESQDGAVASRSRDENSSNHFIDSD